MLNRLSVKGVHTQALYKCSMVGYLPGEVLRGKAMDRLVESSKTPSDDMKQAASVVRQAVEALLSQNRIYKLTNHGWVRPDDTDPEEIGHAMWQMDDPADPVLMRDWYQEEPLHLPEWKTLCSVAGADFEGLMNGARLSIGYALFQIRCLGESLDDEDSLGAMHSRAAYMALSAASERIRTYFTVGLLRAPPKRRSRYVEPFEKAASLVEGVRGIGERFPELHVMAAKVQTFRDQRNAIVHQIATELGRMRQRIIESAATGGASLAGWESLTKADHFHIAQQAQVQEQTKIAEALDAPIEWYRLLISFSEGVFYVENRFRAAHP